MGFDGKHLKALAMDTYGREEISAKELDYLLDMMQPSRYLLRNHTVRNHPITFVISDRDTAKAQAHRPWQMKIINDQHKDKAIIKSRQLGLSEMGVGMMLHFADTHSYASVKCLYTFPTNEQMKKFVQTRLDPVLARGYYSTIVDQDINSLSAKKIRNSFLYFRSSSKPGAVEGVDIDYLSMDEYDRVPALAEASALESMSSSPFKYVTRWSTPSAPDYGIHRLFTDSDQHWYLHKCDRCNHWNKLSYDDYDGNKVDAGGNMLCVNPDGVDVLAKTVVPGSYQFVCQKCGKPLDRWYNGEWVAEFPTRTQGGRGTRGYMISQMNAVWVSADMLKEKELKALSKQAFYNYTLGYPYADMKLQVVPGDVERHTTDRLPTAKFNRGDYIAISVGIDWGNRHWVSVKGLTHDGKIDLIRLFSVSKVGATDYKHVGADLDKIFLELAPYNPDIIVADVGDSGEKVSRMLHHYGEGRVFGCVYNSSPKSTGQLVPAWSENNHQVKVDKLMQNKRYITAMKDGKFGYYQFMDQDLQLYIHHWENVVIRDEEGDDGDFYQVIGRRGDDHYAQASVYAMLGMERIMDAKFGKGNYGFSHMYVNSLPEQTDIVKSLFD